MAVEIRPATPADVDGIRAEARAAWHAAHAPIVGVDAVEAFLADYYDAASVRSHVADDDAVLDVAVDAGERSDFDQGDGPGGGGGPDERVVGHVLASPHGDDGASFALSQIYVVPDRWGEGIGRRLLERVERKVRRRGGERISLGVMAENDRAVCFYEAAGYRRTDTFYDDRIDTSGYKYAKSLD